MNQKRICILAAWVSASMIAPGLASAGGPGVVLHISSHLAQAAKVSIDGRAAVTAPGYGEVEAPIAAGLHKLKVTASGGVGYQGQLSLKTSQLMHWHGRSFWCVNLLKDKLEPYSRSECEEEVTDAG